MKKIVLVILIITFNSCKKNDTNFRIKGNVETISYIYKEATEKFGKVIEGKQINDSLIKLKFNEKGQLTDSLWSKSEYQQANDLWKKNEYQTKKEYKEDLLIRETYYKNKIVSQIKEFSYDDEKKINEITNYDKNKKILDKRVYKYLDKLNYVKIYNGDGSLIETEKMIFDKDNYLIQIINSKGNTTFKYVDGIIREKKHIKIVIKEREAELNSSEHTDKLTYIKISEYDSDGQISKYSEISDFYTTSSNGESYKNGGGSNILKYSYPKYDEFKNWTKQVVRYDTQISHVIERKISYRK